MLNRFVHLILITALCLAGIPSAFADENHFDTIIPNGMLIDGTGQPGHKADLGIRGDQIAAIGDLSDAQGDQEIDASGNVVPPGFINMLSWAVGSLLTDGRGLSDIKQGVTLEVFGEGWSMGPLNDKPETRLMLKEQLGDEVDSVK